MALPDLCGGCPDHAGVERQGVEMLRTLSRIVPLIPILEASCALGTRVYCLPFAVRTSALESTELRLGRRLIRRLARAREQPGEFIGASLLISLSVRSPGTRPPQPELRPGSSLFAATSSWWRAFSQGLALLATDRVAYLWGATEHSDRQAGSEAAA